MRFSPKDAFCGVVNPIVLEIFVVEEWVGLATFPAEVLTIDGDNVRCPHNSKSQ